MIRFSSASILFSVQNQLKLHRKKLQTTKPDHSLNGDRYTATTNIPISWLITMTSCPRSSRLMMLNELLTSLTKRRKNTVNTISSTMPGTMRQHRPGPPWSIAHAKGQNTLLSDDDIVKLPPNKIRGLVDFTHQFIAE